MAPHLRQLQHPQACDSQSLAGTSAPIPPAFIPAHICCFLHDCILEKPKAMTEHNHGYESDKRSDLEARISSILLDEIELAKPDGLEFLEFQAPRIVSRIADRLDRQNS